MKVYDVIACVLAAIAFSNAAELRGARNLKDYPTEPWDHCGCSCMCTGPVCAVPIGPNPNPSPPNRINMTCTSFAIEVGASNGEACTDVELKVNNYVAMQSFTDCSGTFKTK